MTEERMKIALIAGAEGSGAMIESLCHWKEHADICVHTTESEKRLNSTVPMKIYETSPNIPGYMIGLADQLLDYDVILAIDPASICSFQACQLAKANKIPFVVWSSNLDLTSLLQRKNLGTTLRECLESASLILHPDFGPARETLEIFGVEQERLQELKVRFSLAGFSSELRQKFRSYLSISEFDRLVLVQADLSQDSGVGAFLSQLDLATLDNSRAKILLNGFGQESDQLKQLAWKLGIGSRVMFLEQDCQKFERDLYSATDLMIVPSDKRTDQFSRYPSHVKKATLTGVTVATPIGYSYECLGRSQFLNYDPEMNASAYLSRFLDLVHDSKRSLFKEKDSLTEKNELAIRAVMRLPASFPIGRKSAVEEQNIESICIRADDQRHSGNWGTAKELYQQSIEQFGRNLDNMRGLGFVSLSARRYEEAMQFFRKALYFDLTDRDSIFGLGMVYSKVELLGDSLKWLCKAVLQDPDFLPAKVALADVCGRSRDYFFTRKILEDLLSEESSDKVIMLALAKNYISTGDQQRGDQLMRSAMGLRTVE